MRQTRPVHIDEALLAAAEQAAALTGRGATAQLAHWARLGRAVEAAHVPSSAMGAVLGHRAAFDDLSDEDQAVVSTIWAERIDVSLRTLDMAAHHESHGTPYAELDEDGEVVVVQPPTADRG